jgi:peptidoglycan/LPS O-acetylase OafA/YrhL
MRIARLYPLYLLGLMLGCVVTVTQNYVGTIQLASGAIYVLLALGLLMLPAPPNYQPAGPPAFPFDIPTWSLFCEVFANVFHALLLRQRAWILLAAIIFISGAVLLLSVAMVGTMDLGANRRETFYGLFRVMFSYTVGIALFRLWKTGRMRLKISPLIPAVLLLAAFAIPTPENMAGAYDLLAVFCFFPVLLFVSASTEPSPRLAIPAQVLGTTSYDIYVLHFPLMHFFGKAWSMVRGNKVDAPWSGIVFMALIIALVLLADRVYDLRARAWLRGRLLPRRGE